jgi:hypothetical protein
MKRSDACDDRDGRFTYRSLHARAREREPGVCVTSVTSVTGSAPLLMAKQFSHSEKQQQCLHSMYIVRTKPESRGTKMIGKNKATGLGSRPETYGAEVTRRDDGVHAPLDGRAQYYAPEHRGHDGIILPGPMPFFDLNYEARIVRSRVQYLVEYKPQRKSQIIQQILSICYDAGHARH